MTGAAPMVPISAQIKCVERELTFRRRVYARRVSQGKMTQHKADEELQAMGAVLCTLQNIEASQRLI